MKNQVTEIHPFSYHAFLNGLLAEARDRLTAQAIKHEAIAIQLSATTSLQLLLLHFSDIGRHRYSGVFLLHESGQSPKNIDFLELVEQILKHFYLDVDSGKKQRFLTRLKQSNDHILNAKPVNKALPLTPDFIASEQGLLGGHSMHPCPKSSEPLTQEEQTTYLPDYHQTFTIVWYAVKTTHLAGEAVEDELIPQLRAFFAEQTHPKHLKHLSNDWVPIPMHPLQAKYWDTCKEAKALEEQVTPLNIVSPGWQATSSTRAIYHPTSPWMLKMSLPVKLTNSLRLLSQNEANRGIQMSKMLKTPAGIEFKQRTPSLRIIEEPMWCGIKADNGLVIPLSICTFRQNPFIETPQSPNQLLATANQVCEVNGTHTTQIAQWIQHAANCKQIPLSQAAKLWCRYFMDNVIAPLCIARSDYGLILLAHQQNLLLSIQDGLPVDAALKDCQGIGLTDIALQRFASLFDQEPPSYFMPTDEVNPYLAYYLFGNTLATTVANIAANCDVTEEALWLICQEKLHELNNQNPVDGSFLNYLLTSPTLKWKRNLFCFLNDLNETTLTDIALIYCDITNPLYSATPKHWLHKTLPDGRTFTLKSAPMHPEDKQCQFSIYYLGQCLANFSAQLYAPKHVCLEAGEDITDFTLWWCAIEHALFTFQAENIRLLHAPLSFLDAYVLDAGSAHETLTKQQFLARCPTWCATSEKKGQSDQTSMQKASNGIYHPLRPQKPQGVFYQRYFYSLQRTLTFRALDIERDIDCFHQWHNDPQNAAIWELAGSLEKHKEYLSQQACDPHQFSAILEFDGVPFGYVELYWAAEDRLGPHYACDAYDRGLHILVGNPRFKGHAYFKTWSKAMLQYCFLNDDKTQRIMGEPNAANQHVIAISKMIGMAPKFEFDFPHKRAMLLQCERDTFFSQFAI